MSHLDQKTLIAFLRGQISESEIQSVYEHLMECERCSQRHQSLKRIRDDFGGSWEAFLDEWRRLRQKPILRLVAFVQQDPPLALGGLHQLAHGDWTTKDLPVQVGVAGQDARKAEETLARAQETMAQGNREQTQNLLTQLAHQNPDRAAFSQRNVSHKERSTALLIVDAKRQAVSVLIHDPTLGSAVRLVTEEGHCQETPLMPVSGASYRLAEFENVGSGWYTVEILNGPASS